MRHITPAIAIAATLATSAPAFAGNGWHGGGCWNCRGWGIGPGAAVALGLGALALGGALAYPWGYYPPGSYYYPLPGTPYYPMQPPPVPLQGSGRSGCWNSYSQNYYGC